MEERLGFSLSSPFVRAKDSGCKSGHQVVGQADQHDGAGESSEHGGIQVVNEPWEEHRNTLFNHLVCSVRKMQKECSPIGFSLKIL